MIRPHHQANGADRLARRRQKRRPNGERRHHVVPLTEEGVPAATPDAPKASPVVSVSAASRALYPWLPPRVIAGSVWRGPQHQRVRIDASGDAAPWRSGPKAAR